MTPLDTLQPKQTASLLSQNIRRFFAPLCIVIPTLLGSTPAFAQVKPTSNNAYPNMAPLEQYLMPRDAEIVLARSAAPESVSRDAEVLVLGPRGFEVAAAGRNGFVCVVARSWSSPINDPQFWNPKERGPICYNAAAARYFVPLLHAKTKLVLQGKSQAALTKEIQVAIASGEIPRLGEGGMCFMMAKDGYLNDHGAHWHPHLMFFAPATPASTWGADLPGSPVFSSIDELDHITTFMVPVGHWSDGTSDSH